jgi:hypothetical protein
MDKVGMFYGYLAYFGEIRDILRPFGIHILEALE